METVYGEVGVECKDGSTTGIDMNFHNTSVKEWFSKTEAVIPNFHADRIIIPDPTSGRVNSGFYDILPRLVPILEEDSAQDFLRFFKANLHYMAWDLVTPETLLHIILENSVRCAEVVLEGQAPELEGLRAYPNCVTQYGFFPLHYAAEIFSVDMIKLLIQHGALANLRTVGGDVIEGLLPLHVAVENTCMHKYLDDNLFPDESNPDYSKADTSDIYKLIHLLCLPEMKIFMDVTGLLAKHTDNMIGEICNYIKHGKLLQTAVLLLAAQERIRGGCSCKINGNSNQDGFGDIIKYISEHTSAIKLDVDGKEQAQLKENYISSILWLVQAISRTGKALGQCIGRHSKFLHVPRADVLEHVSSILKSYKFSPTGEGVNIGSLNLSRYKFPLPSGIIPDELGNTVAIKDSTHMHAGKEMAVDRELPRGLDLKYKRRSFFPYWRSALAFGFPVKVYPSYSYDDKYHRHLEPFMFKSASREEGSSPAPNHDIDLSAITRQPTSNYQSKRQFGTGALISNYQPKRLFGTAALALLKVLKNA